jgi:aspartate/tyrosine/aromatic aminotransferase
VSSPSPSCPLLNTVRLSVSRASYSNPPIYGARIVAEVLTSPDLKKQWTKDCLKMTQRYPQRALGRSTHTSHSASSESSR